MFDLGICLVLFSMPALAFAVVLPMLLRKRKFVAPFGTWFAAMLVIWVLVGRVAAMVVYMISWYQQSD